MTTFQQVLLFCLLCSVAFLADAFAPLNPCIAATSQVSPLVGSNTCSTPLQATPLDALLESSSSTTTTLVSAATLDPTTFLSDLLGGFISSNLILAVPIVAALALASLVAFGIVAYANPTEPEDE